MKKYKDKLKLMHSLESLRSQLVVCGVQMGAIYGDDFRHTKQLFGAADMTQEWILKLRDEFAGKETQPTKGAGAYDE